MSEPTPEPKDGQEAPAEAKAPKKAGPAAPPILLIVVIVVALAAGAASGALLVAPRLIHAKQAKAFAAAQEELASGGHGKKGKKKDKKDEKGGSHGAEGGKSPIFRLDNLIVNPAGAQGQHFLMCSVAFELEDSKLGDILREHEVELRDGVISTLESQSMTQLTAPGARDSLRSRIAAVAMPLLGEDGEDTELKVFLPQFVIQ